MTETASQAPCRHHVPRRVSDGEQSLGYHVEPETKSGPGQGTDHFDCTQDDAVRHLVIHLANWIEAPGAVEVQADGVALLDLSDNAKGVGHPSQGPTQERCSYAVPLMVGEHIDGGKRHLTGSPGVAKGVDESYYRLSGSGLGHEENAALHATLAGIVRVPARHQGRLNVGRDQLLIRERPRPLGNLANLGNVRCGGPSDADAHQ